MGHPAPHRHSTQESAFTRRQHSTYISMDGAFAMRMQMIKISILVSVVCLCCSCFLDLRPTLTRQDVIGVFVAKYDFGVEVLRFESNDRYTQVFLLASDSTSICNHGSWRISDTQRNRICLDSFYILTNGFGEFNPQYQMPTSIELPFSALNRIWIVEDIGLEYKKLD